MKKLFSMVLALVMVFSVLPVRALAAETEETITDGEIIVDTQISEDTVVSDEDTIVIEEETLPEDEAAVDTSISERVCEEGCILTSEEEHLENGGECFVWISCTLTEGCEGPDGHEGECYGAALYDGTCTVTVSGNSYRNSYVVISNGSTSGLYYINSSGTVQNTDGTAAAFEPGNYTIYYGAGGGRASSFASGSVTINSSASTASVRLSSARVSSSTAYATKVLYATSLFYNTSSFDHVDVRVEGSYVLNVGSQSYSATVSNPRVVVKVGSTTVASKSWTGTTSYEWRQTGLRLTKASVITVELTLDLTYTDSSGQRHVMEDVQISYDSVNDIDRFIDAIAICDMVMGLDFRVTVEDIEEEIQYHEVVYEWKVYNTDGTYTNLPAGAPLEPASTSGHAAGEQYVYDTEYVTGTSFYDYDNGLLYTFHGWDVYSHSSVYNHVVSTGYYALDDGDTTASNNDTIEITADTYIYGYWTATELEPSSAHIAIEKIFIVDGVEMSMEDAEDLWFRVDTGIDRDGDGETMIDVDYSMLSSTASGEYKIPVYQYDTPFVFTEHNADVPGYTRTTTITVSGNYIAGSTKSGDSVTVTMTPVYQGENVHLGTVTYTNTYTKNVGTPVHVYPELTLVKSAADTNLAQDGVVFTLYSDESCNTSVATATTANGGLAYLDFGSIDNIAPGVYYLKETSPLTGYHADPYVYAITLTASQTAEELRGDEYVQVTYYTLSVTVPEESTASYQEIDSYYRLHIYNSPVLGSLKINKVIEGLSDADKSKVNAVVIIHGPITRDNSGNITAVGSTWQLEINSESNWEASLAELPLGEYLLHESFASVHGYTWTGVTYGDLNTTVYNDITSAVFKVESETPVSIELTNTYEEWTAADFYIKKIDENGNVLQGAVFTLTSDEAGSSVITTKTTDADGYAHFYGYTVPEGQSSVTYYLREVTAPDGYYLSNQVYKVVISAVTSNGKTSYEPVISLVAGRSTGFDINTDLLTVTNFPVQGKITITKAFTNGTIPEGMTGVTVQIGGPNGYLRIVELNASNSWSATLEGLALGEYTISELDANVPGYTWSVGYSSTTVTLTEATPGKTSADTVVSGSATVTNTYVRNDEFFEVPTSLTVKKVNEDGQPLAGAVFTLDRLSADGSSIISSASFTTGESGTVVFDLLTGFIDEDGNIIEGQYILSETAAPEGYVKTDTTWLVTVRENDGSVRVVLNENKNIFENFWDWIVGNVSSGVWEDGILTVTNEKKVGNLTITKSVVDDEGLYADAEYSFTLDCSDDAFDKTFTLKAGESLTVENIPWGTTYTLTEDTADAAFTSVTDDLGNGRIWADATDITVTNTYAYTFHNEPLTIVKVDADDSAKVLANAGFTLYADEALETKVYGEVFSDENGLVLLPIETAGTYYLAETTAPEGYRLSTSVYVVTAEEKNIVKNAGTADAVTSVEMHIRIEGLEGTTSNQIDYTYRIENTAVVTSEVSVTKIWYGANVDHPDSVNVTLYRDGEAFATITLSDANDWTHTWTDLDDEYEWTVDEPSVPSGYNKTVRRVGNDFTIVNTHEDNPKTGDFTNLFNTGAMAAVGVVGFGVSASALLRPRKKDDEEAEEQ
ncbi:MAG: Cna B-type domain-containing protein [Oscillospiraceae bacterium]|nr:Cna B-type domain-containing protein [Oscillospiraceae bacterium]